MASTIGKQLNIVANPARQLLFIEGQNLCFNYKTGQWTEIPAYDGLGMYSVNRKDSVIGLFRYMPDNRVDRSPQTTAGAVQKAIVETASQDINEGGRAVIRGVRPLHKGGCARVKVGTQDEISDDIDYSTWYEVNNRSGFADMREEGRYMRVRLEFTDDITTIYGCDVDFMPQGRV